MRVADRCSVTPRHRYVAFIGWACCMIIGTVAIPHIYNGVKVCPCFAARALLSKPGMR